MSSFTWVKIMPFLAITGIGLGVFLAKDHLWPVPKLDDLLRSKRYSVVSADDVEVKLRTPDYGALIKNLNTIVARNLRVLGNSSTTMPSTVSPVARYILLSEDSRFADYSALAIHLQQEDDRIDREHGIATKSKGIPYMFMTPTDVRIYEFRPDGTLKYRQQVCVTHLQIKR